MRNKIACDLESLVIFRGLLEKETVRRLLALAEYDEKDAKALRRLATAFAASLLAQGGNLARYLLAEVLEDENIYTRFYIAGVGDGALLEPLLSYELSLLSEIACYDGGDLREVFPEGFPVLWRAEKIDFAEAFRRHLKRIHETGYGIFARYHMFTVDEDASLVPVVHFDPQSLDTLYGYEKERGKIIANTLALIEGRPANNVLLYGDAGTGKSSTIKAVVNAYRGRGLRLVEVKKNQIHLIPEVIDRLAVNPLKFLLFIDDLTFSSEDKDFCTLKAILEGGANGRGSNTLIYATSNHRHLIKETMGDRTGDEISVSDRRQEIVSLSDRFGLQITFSRPGKELYCEIVRRLAEERGVTRPDDILITRAEAHAIRNGGRNPRTAGQFIDMLLSGVEG